MFIEREDRVSQIGTAAESCQSKGSTDNDEIQRTVNGSIDTDYYIKQSHELRSKCFVQRLKARLEQSS